MSSNTILCVGYARLPEGTTMEVQYKIFGVGLEVDPETAIIVRAQTTCVTVLGDEFLTGMFVGKNIETDFEDILIQVSKRYRGLGGKAILAAARRSYGEYLLYKNEVSHNTKINNISHLQSPNNKTDQLT